jgi:hypothetical protein
VPSVRERRPTLSQVADVLIQKMTAKDKAERYDAPALIRDIERVQRALPFLFDPGFELVEPHDKTSAFLQQKRLWRT